MSNIVKNYFKVLKVISSLNHDSAFKIRVGRSGKMSDLEIVALSLTAEFMSIDSENSLFKQISPSMISNLIQEENNLFDKYGRTLGYLILPNGDMLNETMIKEGYAKPYSDVFCEKLPIYQQWNLEAKTAKKGLYSIVNKF
ncbi:thermonuclease family protein [Flavobacterium palustre]|uniref:thermonuclease family protein n=1 Tax=Flavobacterium palustre TaxID=1476463 RepID=UPI00402B2A98